MGFGLGGDVGSLSPDSPDTRRGRQWVRDLSSTVVLELVRLLRGERLSIHASICKVRYLTFLSLISLPRCTAEQ